MNRVRTDSTPSLTLLSDRKDSIRDAVERVLTSSWAVSRSVRNRNLPRDAVGQDYTIESLLRLFPPVKTEPRSLKKNAHVLTILPFFLRYGAGHKSRC